MSISGVQEENNAGISLFFKHPNSDALKCRSLARICRHVCTNLSATLLFFVGNFQNLLHENVGYFARICRLLYTKMSATLHEFVGYFGRQIQ